MSTCPSVPGSSPHNFPLKLPKLMSNKCPKTKNCEYFAHFLNEKPTISSADFCLWLYILMQLSLGGNWVDVNHCLENCLMPFF